MTARPVDSASPLHNRAHDALNGALNDNPDAVLDHCRLLTRTELAHLADAARTLGGTALAVMAETWPNHPDTDAAMRRHQHRAEGES